jgi:excisionase family DNA binding protein
MARMLDVSMPSQEVRCMKVTKSAAMPSAVMIDRRRLLRPDELAAFLGIPLATIYRWRSRGDGPRGIRVGRHVRYRVEEVERWLDEH